MGNAANILSSPVNVLWKIEARETFEFKNVTAAGIGGQYVDIYLPDGTFSRVWFDENDTDTAPSAGGGTLVEVDYAASATAAQIATAFIAEVDAITGLNAVLVTGSTTQVRVTRTSVGEVTLSSGTAVSIIIGTERKGKDFDLGLLEGDIELPAAPETLTISAHQFGVTPVAVLGNGFGETEVELTMLETDAAKLEELYRVYGGSETPSGGSEVFGMGTSFLGKAMLTESARLVFKPVNATNDQTNFNYLAALPVPSTLTLSGENPRKLTVTFQCLADTEFDTKFNFFAFGDIFQAGL